MGETRVTIQQERVQTRQGISTVTTTQSTTVRGGTTSGSWNDTRYFCTIQGWLKIAQLVLGAVVIGCLYPTYKISEVQFLLSMAYIAASLTLIWIILYLFRLRESITISVNWILLEIGITGVVLALYIIAVAVFLAWISGVPSLLYVTSFVPPKSRDLRPQYLASGIFGLATCIAYLVGIILLFKTYRTGRVF